METLKAILSFFFVCRFRNHSWEYREEKRNVIEFQKWEEVQPDKTSKLITGEEREVVKTFLIRECKVCDTVMAKEC